MKNIKDFSVEYFKKSQENLSDIDVEKVDEIAEVLFDAYKNGKQIFIFGNGGSASTASHFACDLNKTTLRDVHDGTEMRFRAVALTDNMPVITAFANDLSYEDIFSQQLRNFLNKDDVVIGISCSGNSPNVVKAVAYAKDKGAKTIGFLGFRTGGKLRNMVDYEITVQDDDYWRVEDVHLMLCHFITAIFHKLKRHELA